MKVYYYKLPVLKMSAACVELIDDNGSPCGRMTRTFKHLPSKAICWIIDSWELSFRAEAEQCAIELLDRSRWFERNKWSISCKEGDEEQRFSLKDRTMIRTNPRFEFTYNGQPYEVVQAFLDKRTRIINLTQNKVSAEMERHSIGRVFQRKITMYDEELNPLLAACIDRLIRTLN
ncbi:hypothetical protein MKX50_10430 [Paenibacillus sp. FSL W8-0186]|uniref:Tubby C-terminal domain-containing protein n=1 Tax=Paenibacillus woosongensis TaxID=307580 RepID=A0ABQ4ML04_9BACL|nr:hypothetical protein [Paenibacillus woosongensis]GIP56653.1 hypothetical protein J15TS10_04670 [Paenibacillus woosongensis]